MKDWLFRSLLCLLLITLTSHATAARQVEINTSQVTSADITLSPDSKWLIFTLLGHLFRLPVEGGRAEQLTFGPYYDTDPVISPDGRSVAFVSDRDKSAGNIFMSAHEDRTIDPTFLAYGITSIQISGGRLDWLNTIRDRGNTTNAPLPRYFSSGERLEGTHPTSGDWFFPIDTEQEIQAAIRRHKEAGATLINAYASLPWPLHRPVAEAARQAGLPVMIIGMNVEWIIKAITLGYAILEHTPCPNRLYDDVLQLMAIAGTRWTPTLSFVGGSALLLRDEPERLQDKKFLRFTPEWVIRGSKKFGYMKDAEDKALRGSWVEQLAGIQAAHRQGIGLHISPHSPAWQSFVGASLHWELEHFVQAGLAPLEVLRLATQEAARAVGAEEDLGTLTPGKLADIVLLDHNPLDDIRNTQTI